MGVRIITDSTCDLDFKTQQELNIEVIPLSVIFEDGIYRDGVEISKEAFYEKQASVKVLPKTAQANPAEFCDVFEENREDEIVGIFLSSKLSGTFQSACIAREMLDGRQIHLVDSLNVTVGLGLLVRQAAAMREQGLSAREIAARIESLKRRVRFVAFVNTLKYLKMGGRIPASTAVFGTMLGISPVVSIENGKLESIGKVKGKQKILEFTTSFVNHHLIDYQYPVAFAHSHALETAAAYREKCCRAFHIENSVLDELGAVLGTHAGPGCYGMAYIERMK
ncbi:DegV family protein [Oscillibacter hominis]|uniref:DegV family protein n=1 Tax=Oscillibacter hominis TaxID=2763056 RepID=A0A7G9B5H7_9FIRM|nr:DegV family protein [Oscillibacter hominis]QNL44808.1 DegV family protein [Oscillibacter hominis]